MKKFWLLTGVLVFLVVLCIPSSQATIFNLLDENSTADIDTGSSSGMFNWTVDGIDHLFNQWFYYRIGGDPNDPNDATPEQSVDTLALGIEGTTDTDFDGDQDTLFIRYLGAGFNVELKFSLTGAQANTNTSDIAEQIVINNTGNTALDFHFYQYTDFDLGGLANDTVSWVNANTFRQFDSLFVASETIATPAANFFEAGFVPSTFNKLNDGNADNLNNFGGPLTGDVTFAWQWDFTIAAGGTVDISKDKNISPPIPEPGTLLLLGSGLVGLAGIARRRKKMGWKK
jgi:hypothetical protein